MSKDHIKIESSLLTADLNGYSEEAQNRKISFHKAAKKLLSSIAKNLGIQQPYRLDTNMGGIAVAGETTLHADTIYIQLCKGMSGQGNQIMYRTCTSQKDFSGGQNKFVSLSDFADQSKQRKVLEEMLSMSKNNSCNQKTNFSPSRKM